MSYRPAIRQRILERAARESRQRAVGFAVIFAVLCLGAVVTRAFFRRNVLSTSDLTQEAVAQRAAELGRLVSDELGQPVEPLQVRSLDSYAIGEAVLQCDPDWPPSYSREVERGYARSEAEFEVERDAFIEFVGDNVFGVAMPHGANTEIVINHERLGAYAHRHPEVGRQLLDVVLIHELIHVYQGDRLTAAGASLGAYLGVDRPHRPCRDARLTLRAAVEGYAEFATQRIATQHGLEAAFHQRTHGDAAHRGQVKGLFPSCRKWIQEFEFVYLDGAAFVAEVAKHAPTDDVWGFLQEHPPETRYDVRDPASYVARSLQIAK